MTHVKYTGDGSQFVVGVPPEDFDTDDPALLAQAAEYPVIYTVGASRPTPTPTPKPEPAESVTATEGAN